MILLFQIGLVILILKGLQLMLDYIYNVPPKKTKKSLEKTINVQKTIAERFTEELIRPLIFFVEPFVKISEEKENRLKQNLARADMTESPSEYYAKAIVLTLLTVPLPIFLWVFGMKMFVPLSVILIIVVFYKYTTNYKDALSKKKEKIELGLPGFIRSILYKLSESTDGIVKADLISIFEDYLKVASPVFAYDISILIMEMKSKDVENALRSFNSRVAIPEVGFLCNALIGITRGERQNETLSSLARDMDVKGKENIRRELAKRPGKVFIASIPLVLVAILALAYVLVTTLMQGVATLS